MGRNMNRTMTMLGEKGMIQKWLATLLVMPLITIANTLKNKQSFRIKVTEAANALLLDVTSVFLWH